MEADDQEQPDAVTWQQREPVREVLNWRHVDNDLWQLHVRDRWHAACRGHSIDCLTRRERDLITDVSEGLTDKEIARRRQIALGTVKNHLSNARCKLGVRTRVKLALLVTTDELERLRLWREQELSRRAEHERMQCKLRKRVLNLQSQIGQLREERHVVEVRKADWYPRQVID